MSLRSVMLLAVVIVASAAGWLYWTVTRARGTQNRVEQAVQNEISFTTNWPAEGLNDSPWLQRFGGFNPVITTNWYRDDTGQGQMHYGVELDPASTPGPGMLQQVADNCRFSLEIEDRNGDDISTLPLPLSFTRPTADQPDPILGNSGNLRMSDTVYTALTGANGTPDDGLSGSLHLGDTCPDAPPPAASLLHH